MTAPRPIGFRPEEISSMINEEVVAIHADDAAFLWILRSRAVHAPHYSLQDLADLDERVEAHVDGLRVAGDFGWEVCESTLDSADAGEAFAAAVLAFGSCVPEQIEAVVKSCAATPELQPGLISAIGWNSFDGVHDHIVELCASEDAAVQRVGIGAHAVHRVDPGPLLEAAIASPDGALRARALQAAGELGRVDLAPAIRNAWHDADDDCRFQAAWSATRLGDRDALPPLLDVARADGPHAEQAIELGMRTLQPPEAETERRQLRAAGMLRLATIAAGAIASIQAIPELLELMREDDVARVAGQSFTRITGVDLAYHDLDRDPPEGFTAGPSESPDDDDVAMDPDEDLPWPAPDLVAGWWEANASRFRRDARYLAGHEIAPDSLRDTLIRGQQRDRIAAALELALRNPNEPLFECRARGCVQQDHLAPWS